ncbi:MAG: tRNA pseudouridine(38-40) synthase TruA [Saprospiraceae bacterium]
MKRYFFQIMYDGTAYSGWQKQDNAPSVQECLESALTKLARRDIEIVGCGRTDAGVHAYDYFFHADLDAYDLLEEEYRFKLNKMLPRDIAIVNIIPVPNEAHARFDASNRSYIYRMHFKKDPFLTRFSYRYNQSGMPDFAKMNEAASLFMNYNSFFPFCKTHTDVNNYDCELFACEWIKEENLWSFDVSANRFLRGMIRLMAGACIRVASGKLNIEKLKLALDKQERLEEAWSVPACGLGLSRIEYPFINKEKL